MVKVAGKLRVEFVALLLLLVLAGVFVIADTVTSNIATLNFAEDVSSIYNFSINSTGVETTQNITWINITIPASFAFNANTNFSNAGAHTFANTSIILSFFNAGGLIMNTSYNFAFNATAATPGTFNITVQAYNVTAETNYTNFTVTINDTTAPNVSYVAPTPNTEANSTSTEILVNVSATDNLAVNVIRLYLFNSSYGLVNNTNSTSNPAFVNFTGLSDGVYYFNATANDTSGNQNLTGQGTRTFRIDTAAPNVSFISPSGAAEANFSTSEILVNFSATDTTTYVGTMRIYLFNGSHSLVNNTNSSTTAGSASVNFTGLADGTYYVNATVNDSLGNQNLTGSGRRLYRVDTAAPNASFISPSPATETNSTITEILVNFSATDTTTYVGTMRIYLFNGS